MNKEQFLTCLNRITVHFKHQRRPVKRIDHFRTRRAKQLCLLFYFTRIKIDDIVSLRRKDLTETPTAFVIRTNSKRYSFSKKEFQILAPCFRTVDFPDTLLYKPFYNLETNRGYKKDYPRNGRRFFWFCKKWFGVSPSQLLEA
ncbi:hypothetical protein KKE06_04465 [Candidatus Micrarchaeota archaeon]|nr:hypothetical protein [Candidatus Micrarchaeota archaeon]